ALAATKPSKFVTARTLTIPAPADAIFPHVNNFHKWDSWNPFLKFDPNAKKTYAGPESGVGAHYAWDGNKQAGTGSCTITESRPGELIRMDLEFLKPFKASNKAEFRFERKQGGTAVTWQMSGKSPLMMRIFGLFMDCDKMVGDSFEEGLANLSRVAQESA